MAYVNQSNNTQALGMNKEEEKDQNGQPIQSSTSSAPVSGSPVQTNQQAKPASSGTKAGFQNYAKANEGASQQKLGQSTAQNLQTKANIATSGINQAGASFQNKMNQGSLANRESAVQDVTGIVSSARGLQANTPAAQSANAQQILAAQNQTTQSQVQNTNPNALTNEQTKRFADVINAKYSGPESLRQAGLYQDAAGKVATAQTALDQSKTAQGREDLLRSIYQNKGNYTTGLNKLDAALLNQSQSGINQLQNVAKAAGNVQGKLDQAQIQSSTAAQNRAKEISDIAQQSRNIFSSGKSAEETATENRLDALTKTPVLDAQGKPVLKADGSPMTEWDRLPEYFKGIVANKENTNKQVLEKSVNDFKQANNYQEVANKTNALASSLKNAKYNLSKLQAADNVAIKNGYQRVDPKVMKSAMDTLANAQSQFTEANNTKKNLDSQLKSIQGKFNENAVILNPFEASVLGVKSGEGLYNMGPDAIKTALADRERLITKDEQLRQAALAQLAGLDTSNTLDTNLRYGDASKAGTQSLLDALDLAGTRQALNAAESSFREGAEGADIVGRGTSKISRGNAFGKKTRTYRSTAKGNVGEMLDRAGYDLESPVGEQGQTTVNGTDLLRQAMQAIQNRPDYNADTEENKQVIGSALQGGATGAGIGYTAGGPIGAAIGATAGASLGASLASGTADPYQFYTDLARGAGGPLSELANGYQEGRNIAGNIAGTVTSPIDSLAQSLGLGSGLSSGLKGAIGGIDVGAMNKTGNAEAKMRAQRDLQKKFSDYLAGQGFENRLAVTDNNEAVNSRLNALTQLLSNLDKRNT